jgi:hypothetical protein
MKNDRRWPAGRRLPEVKFPVEAAGLCPGLMAGGYILKNAVGAELITAPGAR